jgi:hypothetical protein
MPSKSLLRWRREMIDAYYDAQTREILVPLAAAAREWESGDISNNGLIDEVARAHRATRSFDGSFVGGHDILETLIQANENWYVAWIQDHPRPVDDRPD